MILIVTLVHRFILFLCHLGVFDQIELALYLKRDVHYYIMEYYIPVIGMVSLSFVAFWIHFEATTARVALPTTTFLAMTTMINHIRSSSAIYATAEALEIFLNISLYFVISSLFEYVVVELTDSRWVKVRQELSFSFHSQVMLLIVAYFWHNFLICETSNLPIQLPAV